MNINYGLLPPADAPARGEDGRKLSKLERTRAKKRAIADRALADLGDWLAQPAIPGPRSPAPAQPSPVQP